MTTNANTPQMGQSLALFCGTALIYRRIELRRERQAKRRSYASENGTGIGTGRRRSLQYANADGEEDVDATDIYQLQGLRKRVSFDGYASFSAMGPSSDAIAPPYSAAPTANGGYSSAATTDTNTSATNTSRKLSWTHEDDLRTSFVIYGGDEMDDDEVEEQGQAAVDENASRGGVMTSAGASAAKSELMRIRGETNASTARGRGMSSPIQEGLAEDEGSIDGDGENDEPGAPGTPWGAVGGLLRQVSGISRGVSFFVEGIDDDGMSYHERREDDIGSSGTSVSRRLDVSTRSGAPSIEGRRCSSQPSMTDLWSLAQQQSLAQQSALNERESAKQDYNSRIMPNKVVLIRHGQSEGNVEEGLYATTPDNAMCLTALGWDQAKMAGRELKSRVIAKDESIHFVVSPYVRTVETFHGILSAWCDPEEFSHIKDHEKRLKAWYGRLSEMGISWHEDPRIREQDFGNYQDPVTIKKCKRERHKFGTFYYRFPHGESASDVYDRVSTFLDSLWRSFDLKRSQNYVLVTHGISIRILLSRYFRYSIDQFNMLANPKNCDFVVLGHDGKGRLRLEGRHELVLKKREQKGNVKDEDAREQMSEEEAEYKSQYQTDTLIEGYRYQDRLRILPKEWRVKRKIRLSYHDGQEQSNNAS